MPLLVPPRGLIRPLFHPAGGVPPHLRAQFPCCRPLPANVKGLGVEKQNPSRRVRHHPPSRRFKPQGLRVVPKGTCLLKVRSFLANAPNVVATRSRKQTHSEGQCRQWSAVYYTGGPKAESPLSQGPQPVFVNTLYTLSVHLQTHLHKSSETSLIKGKERYKVNP